MKIIIEPDDTATYYRVEIYKAGDDLNIDEIWGMLRQALIAHGFDPDTVKDWFWEE